MSALRARAVIEADNINPYVLVSAAYAARLKEDVDCAYSEPPEGNTALLFSIKIT